MNAPPVLSPAPLERAGHLTVLADRERIARDLNDHVIQRIFAVGLDMQGTIARSRSSEITVRLNRSVADLQAVIEDICNIVFESHVATVLSPGISIPGGWRLQTSMNSPTSADRLKSRSPRSGGGLTPIGSRSKQLSAIGPPEPRVDRRPAGPFVRVWTETSRCLTQDKKNHQ
jgi:hypothetical protein